MEHYTSTLVSTALNVLQPDPHDNEKLSKVLSDEGRLLFEIVSYVIICGVVGFFGIIANSFNIIVFSKQGFSNTVNIAFLGLAISDMCCLITLEWSAICMNPLFATYEVPWIQIEVMYITAGWPHICFCRITSYITVYITAERCLCIILPLKVKQMITKRVTTIIIVLIYIVNLLAFVPESASSYLNWKFFPDANKTLLSIDFRSYRKSVEGISYVMHSMFSATSFVGVIIFTTILVVTLRKSSTWRNKVTAGVERQSMSTRDRTTVKMIILIATVLIICYTPGAIVSMTTYAVGPEFNIKGRYLNMCAATWSIAFAFQTINSSVNIFLYYKMSTKYRTTFNEHILKFLIAPEKWKCYFT